VRAGGGGDLVVGGERIGAVASAGEVRQRPVEVGADVAAETDGSRQGPT
jgi:hypothetical protein